MAESVFNKETLLDLSVNVIPLGIMGFFLVLFAAFGAWSGGTFIEIISLGLVVVPFVSLAVLTYLAALKIEVATGT